MKSGDDMKYVAEIVGTMLLILIGNGSVCNVSLKKSCMKNATVLMVNICWGCAVILPAILFGSISGAVFNPALALALALLKKLSWLDFLFYTLSEFLGAFLGQILVYLLFKKHMEEEEPIKVLSCFCTSPSIRDIKSNVFQEAVATFVLVFPILGLASFKMEGIFPSIYAGIVVSTIGMAFGGLTGYAINPARDLAPRICYRILPMKNKISADFKYSIAPVLGPILGSVVASGLAYLCFYLVS